MALKFLDAPAAAPPPTRSRRSTTPRRHGRPIANNSWGGAASAQVLLDAHQRPRPGRLLFVAAAGNDGVNNDDAPFVPAPTYDVPNIISVAATDRTTTWLAAFSNYGVASVDLAAPGKDIYSTWTACRRLPYDLLSGTSMATPMVTGAAALVRRAFPARTPSRSRRC